MFLTSDDFNPSQSFMNNRSIVRKMTHHLGNIKSFQFRPIFDDDFYENFHPAHPRKLPCDNFPIVMRLVIICLQSQELATSEVCDEIREISSPRTRAKIDFTHKASQDDAKRFIV